MSIKDPQMVYKIYEQKTIYEDRPGAGYDRTIDVPVAECMKSEEILQYLHFGKYYKITYEVYQPSKE